MQYMQAREIADKDGNHTGKWRWTSMWDDRIVATGYCGTELCEHDTPEEAATHYRTYLLDHARYNATTSNAKYLCEVEGCEEWTHNGVIVDGYERLVLCDAHNNREQVEKLYHQFGADTQIMSS